MRGVQMYHAAPELAPDEAALSVIASPADKLPLVI